MSRSKTVTRTPEGIKIEVMRCNGPCRGRRALSLRDQDDSGGYRLTGHKCAGSWTTEDIFEIDDSGMDALVEAISEFRKGEANV